MFENQNHQIVIIIVTLVLTVSGCDQGRSLRSQNLPANCPNAELPCIDDPSNCCPVICQEFYHLGGPDNTICLPDTSSHAFTWEVSLPLDGVANDAEFMENNEIWIVGEFSQSGTTFNWLRLSENNLELDNIIIYGDEALNPPLKAIHTISSNQTWILGAFPHFWDGEAWLYFNLVDLGVLPGGLFGDVWASAADDVYFVGVEGRIVRYNGTVFTRIYSDTTIPLSKVHGSNPENVWICGHTYDRFRSIILHYDGYDLRTVYDDYDYGLFDPDSLSGLVESVFAFDQDSAMVLTSLGIYRCAGDSNGEARLSVNTANPHSGINTLEGISIHDLLYSGTDGQTCHYNGASERVFDETLGPHTVYGCAITENEAILVGSNHELLNRAVFIRGHR
ncbi:MAG: hypothetical protein H8D46_00205 [FCB group bacterium]|nr:hypothetical protein [FCB group bacterium]